MKLVPLSYIAVVVLLVTIVIEIILSLAHMVTFAFADFLLSTYIVTFCALCLLSELRFVPICRRCSYRCLQHIYFLTTPRGRGVFYIFLAGLMLDGIAGYVIGCILGLLGVANLIGSCFCPLLLLPDYRNLDREEREQRELRLQPPQPAAMVVALPAFMEGNQAAAAAQFAYENREYITRENVEQGLRLYNEHKDLLPANP
eukprot:TRINITY_DN14119_c0_g1_i1.p1 TRINITY_DN14119_c0_g1~~TRINITY_DN14119_c0_g1_i1.p1  ORF type:complete len:201 (-),score=25.94 TRINITY_DN14119_c0_g1_i1:20-622(-)